MNDTPEKQQEQSPQYLHQASPGTRLRQARETAGLSRGEVAMQMRINERKVAALEEDRYDIFPSDTFVSGYLRSYAKVLGLPENDFVRPVSSSKSSPSLVPNIGTGKQASSMDLPVRMVTYGIVALVMVSLAMWLISQRVEPVVEPAEQPAVAQEETAQPAAEAAAAEPENSAVSEEVAATQGTDDEVVLNGEEQTVSAPAEEAVTAENEASAPPVTQSQQKQAASERQDPSVPPMVVPEAKTENEIVEGAAVPVPPPLTDSMPRSILTLEYESDSWTEVNDKAGRQLVYGLMRAGQTAELKGEAPFKVFLGFAEGVTVHYNDDLFDHSAFRRGKVARFRVGRAEDNQPGSR